jgi:hypothetical protein
MVSNAHVVGNDVEHLTQAVLPERFAQSLMRRSAA